jgi:hypothetical protein
MLVSLQDLHSQKTRDSRCCFNFFTTQQILPRLRTDFPCANKYQQTGSDLVSKDKTLDVATWNVAWFGMKLIHQQENQTYTKRSS